MGAGHGEACCDFVPLGNEVIEVGARIREPRKDYLHLFLHALATALRAIPAVPTDPGGGIEPIDGRRSFVVYRFGRPSTAPLVLFGHRNPSTRKVASDDPVLDLCSEAVKDAVRESLPRFVARLRSPSRCVLAFRVPER